MKTPRDYEGWVAIILSTGLVLGLLALLTDLGGARATSLDSTLLATVFGGLIATLGQYIGARTAKRRPDPPPSEETDDG